MIDSEMQTSALFDNYMVLIFLFKAWSSTFKACLAERASRFVMGQGKQIATFAFS